MKISFVVAVLFAYYTICGQNVVFPNEGKISYVSGGNSTIIVDRIPVYIPGACPKDMLCYPGDGSKSSWVCDCKPRFLYFPQNDSCYEAFKQGPCSQFHYVVLPEGEAIPRCEPNHCLVDNVVKYNGVCHSIKAPGGPCGPDGTLDINETTFQLECVPNIVVPLYIIDPPKKICPPGTRRSTLDMCKKVV